MNSRELAICLDVLGGNQLDRALTEHIDYICEHCLVNEWTIIVGGLPFAIYNYKDKTWKLGSRLTGVLLALGLMNEQEEFCEEKAREIYHGDFDTEWGSPSKPEDTGWDMSILGKKEKKP